MNKNIESFIENTKWIFAKTYAKTWPHEYTLLKDTDKKEIFLEFVKLINTNGYKEMFYKREMTYYKHKDMVYWTMDESIEKIDLINRVHESGTYAARLKNGTLPGDKK